MSEWISWSGVGPTPILPLGTMVNFRLRRGDGGSAPWEQLSWLHAGSELDIVAYLPDFKASHKALAVQVGGSHYKGLAIQPVEYIHRNGIGFCEGNAIKYLTRWREKGGVEDLKKAKHYIDLLIEMEAKETKHV